MKKIITKIGLVLAIAATAITLMSGSAFAFESINDLENPALAGANSVRANGMPEHLIGDSGIFTKLTNTLFYAVGIITVIMLVIGGFKYIISGGDGKNTAIGVVIVVLTVLLLLLVLGGIGFAVYHLIKGDLSTTQIIVLAVAAAVLAALLLIGKLKG